MDTTRVDRLARGLAGIGTRRTTLRLLSGGLAAALLPSRAVSPARAQGTVIFDNCPFPGWVTCGESCVNPYIDSNNCGTCGVVCESPQTCQFGTCVWERVTWTTTEEAP
jgi:hypothetical protein